MSKTLLSTALIAGLGLAFVPGAHAAADGTITINGLVLGTTCTINGGTSSFTVTLPTVKTTDFATNVAGKTQFDLNLTNCPTGVDFSPAVQVSTTFSGTNIDSTTGLLKDTSATNNGVAIELLDNTSTKVDLTKTTAIGQSSEKALVDSSGNATLSYYAQYRQTGTSVTAGRVITTVDYTINYL